MPRINAPKKSEQRTIINISFFILLSIPLVVFGLLQDSFDTRNRAFEDLELSDENPCIISLPHVNPYTLEVGKTITIQVDARLKNSGISGLEITDSSGISIHQESFEDSPLEIGTSFTYTPEKSGMIDILGMVRKVEGGSVACKISSPFDVKGLRAVANNLSPEFTSKVTDSKPSQDIKTETTYEYTLTAEDKDGDRINYFYSFTPRADWLKPTIIEDGSSGKLTIKFKGTSEEPASYLANVFIHDGYSKHLRSQSWVISVSPAENDIPIIKIINPVESLRLDSGNTFKTSWESSDLNHITKYQLFMAKNIADENSWIQIDNNIPYNQTSYTVPTSNLSSGTYKLVAKAIDNRTPAGIGTAVSPEIVISKTTDIEDKNDDDVVMEIPQVTNMSPSSTDEITNKRTTIKATITASNGATINNDSISFKVDGIDVLNKVKTNKISDSEYTLIYQPQEDLTAGVHKAEIYLKDSSEKEITKGWDFTITEEKTEDSDSFNIFGYSVAKKTVMIIGIGIFAISIALVAPFVIASIWKEDKSDKSNSKLPSSLPSEEESYIQQSSEMPEVKEMIESAVPQEESTEHKKDVWDSYTAPTPIIEPEIPQPSSEIPTVQPIEVVEPEMPQPAEIPTLQTTEAVAPEIPEPIEIPTPQTTEEFPTIPEPEIPGLEQLQSINDQIVQQTQEEQTNSTPQ
ncbi:hypothetical protein GYA44_02560 [Candidatus Microgenomates bacterium]|nr:hypothetical protein [Candidatus Microgenomates bacterium]